MTNWVDSPRVGDKVLDGDGLSIKSTGLYSRFIRETSERILEITEKRLRSKLEYTIKNVKLNRLSTDTLQKIVDLIEADKGAE